MEGSKRSVNRAATIMFLYAIVVLAVSLLAYLIAPPGANATTAIVVGGVAAVLTSATAVFSLMIHKNRPLGMIGIHLGLLLPLLFSVGFLMRIPVAYGDSGVYRYFNDAFAQKVADGGQQDTPEARTAFFANAEDELAGAAIPTSDKAYLGRTLTLLFGASTAAFVLLLLSRPNVPKAADDPFAADTPASNTGKAADFKG